MHRFEDAKRFVKMFEGPDRDASQQPDKVIAAMQIVPAMVVADIGTGTGYFLPYLSKAVGPTGRVLALDIEPAMVRHVLARAKRDKLDNVEPRLVLVESPLLHAASLDRILIVNTWHHIPDRSAYASQLAAALVAGGSVWVVDFKMTSKRGPAKAHRLLPDVVDKELTAAGLKVTIDTTTLTNQYLVVGRKALPPPRPVPNAIPQKGGPRNL